eukprot:4090087-Pyramimonas_sp.AAC.1
MFAHLSQSSWPHRELHRMLQWQCSHAVLPPFRCPSHTVRGPIGGSTECLGVRARMQLHPHFGAPLTRFVAP